MEIVFDPAKDAANRVKHGISLKRAKDIAIVMVIEDDRYDYGEKRYRAFGFIDDLPHCLVFAHRGNAVRAISLRRAHWKELQRYADKNK
jgi:uncharacterized DUF497 family protein